MSVISIHNIRKFVRKTPEQKRITARFFTALWLGQLKFAPHKLHLSVPPHELVSLWWSHFHGVLGPGANSIFTYRGDDIGDLRFLWKYLKPGMTFFDVGAHEGIYAVIAAKKVGHTGSVAAFEPSPRERRRLRLHFRLNRLESATIVPCAVAAEEGEGTLATVISGNTGKNSLVPPLTPEHRKPITVRVTTLDKHLELTKTRNVDLIKLDTEGAELRIIDGAEALLRNQRPLILCEILDPCTLAWGYRARQIIERLLEHGYQWFEIQENGSLVRHEPKDEYPVDENYLAIPVEKLSQINGLITA